MYTTHTCTSGHAKKYIFPSWKAIIRIAPIIWDSNFEKGQMLTFNNCVSFHHFVQEVIEICYLYRKLNISKYWNSESYFAGKCPFLKL